MLVQSLRLVSNSVRQMEFTVHSNIVFVRRFFANANLAPHQSVQVRIRCGTRYVDFSFFVRRLDFSDRSIRLCVVFDSTFDLIPYSASINLKAWYRRCFDSKPPNIPAYRPGDPGVFHSRCQGLWTHVTHLSLTQTPNSCRSAPFVHRLLNFCNRRTEFNKKT